VLLWLFLAKYQGIANMLNPCENPDIALAKKSKNKGVLFVLFGFEMLLEFINFTDYKVFQKYCST
jgi:hypothetical protein